MSNTKTFPKGETSLQLTTGKMLEITSTGGNDTVDLNTDSATIWVDGTELKIGINTPLSTVKGKTIYPKEKLSLIKFSIVGTDDIAELTNPDTQTLDIGNMSRLADDPTQDFLIVGTDEIAEGRALGSSAVKITPDGMVFLVTHGTV